MAPTPVNMLTVLVQAAELARDVTDLETDLSALEVQDAWETPAHRAGAARAVGHSARRTAGQLQRLSEDFAALAAWARDEGVKASPLEGRRFTPGNLSRSA